MGFHYAKEKAKFDREWCKLRKLYEQAGMSESAIDEIYTYASKLEAHGLYTMGDIARCSI